MESEPIESAEYGSAESGSSDGASESGSHVSAKAHESAESKDFDRFAEPDGAGAPERSASSTDLSKTKT